jgi:hypothetical protein
MGSDEALHPHSWGWSVVVDEDRSFQAPRIVSNPSDHRGALNLVFPRRCSLEVLNDVKYWCVFYLLHHGIKDTEGLRVSWYEDRR